jgi:hypothetical protein
MAAAMRRVRTAVRDGDANRLLAAMARQPDAGLQGVLFGAWTVASGALAWRRPADATAMTSEQVQRVKRCLWGLAGDAVWVEASVDLLTSEPRRLVALAPQLSRPEALDHLLGMVVARVALDRMTGRSGGGSGGGGHEPFDHTTAERHEARSDGQGAVVGGRATEGDPLVTDKPPTVQRVHLKSPVLVMLASAEGLTGAALAAAKPLRLALDERRSRIARLDALDVCVDRLWAVMPEARALECLIEELLTAVEPALHGPRHRELQLKPAVRRIGVKWRDLRTEGWDSDNPDGLTDLLTIPGADQLRKDLAPIMRLCWREPLDEQLHDTEEAAALIRLLRLYVQLNLDTSLDQPAQPTLNACARAFGMWAAVEQRLPGLPTRPGGPAALYWNEESDETSAMEPGAALRALLRDSVEVRQQATFQVAGHTDIMDAVQTRPASKSAGSSPMVPRPTSTETAITAARDAAVAASVMAVAAHQEMLAERFPQQSLSTLVEHTTWVVIREPIAEMRDKDDRLILASYEGLRVPLPLALLTGALELEARIAQLHAEFPWATRAIEIVAGEMLARRRLGAVSFAWAPILLVGPPGTGKTRLARRLAEVMGLSFLPLGVGGSSDSKLLTGTNRGWASGEPSPIVRALRDRRMAQILVLLDEVDKCSHRTVNAAPIQAALLGLLEPESSRNWIDAYLQVPCDLSKLLFVATANRLGTIDAALMSRLQPVLVPTPERRHYPSIIEQVVRDVANDWGLPQEVMPELDVSGIAQAAGSVRELVRLVRKEIVREVSAAGARH